MQLEATGHPIKYRLLDGREIILLPGVPVSLPDSAAKALLKKAGDRVRAVEKNPRPVYFEMMRGEILGPAVVLHLTAAPDGQGRIWAWFCLSYRDSWRWVREDRLRSKSQFENQVKPKVVELIREPR